MSFCIPHECPYSRRSSKAAEGTPHARSHRDVIISVFHPLKAMFLGRPRELQIRAWGLLS